MSVTSGFFNSLNHDRLYNAEQFSSMFDGLINDGVYQSIGSAFKVTANSGMTINIGTGRAWFNHTWTLNDSVLPLDVPAAHDLLDRYDAVMLEVNSGEGVRANTIKIVSGTPSSTALTKNEWPKPISTEYVHQYVIAHIKVPATTKSIGTAQIVNRVGTTLMPYVNGLIEKYDIERYVNQWQALWDAWYASAVQADSEYMEAKRSSFNLWEQEFKAEGENWIDSTETDMLEWFDRKKVEFQSWFSGIVTDLDGDVAGNLLNRINEIGSTYYVSLVADEWVADNDGSYIQTVLVPGMKDEYNPILVSKLDYSATFDTAKAYNKAFSIVSQGVGSTANNSVSFRVFKLPETTITVGLRGK